MEIRREHIAKVAKKLGYNIRQGSKHILVLNEQTLVTTIPLGKIKDGTLRVILKRLDISLDLLSDLL